jgi:four helix bundle protein
MQDFRHLKAWQSALNVAVQTRKVASTFPRSGYGELKAQMISAAESIGSNIAEGRAVTVSDIEFVRFLDMALRSAAETESELKHALEYGVVSERAAFNLTGSIICTKKLIESLQATIRRDIELAKRAKREARRKAPAKSRKASRP